MHEFNLMFMLYCPSTVNPSCEATPYAPDILPFKRDGLLSRVKLDTFMFRFALSSDLSREVGLFVRVATHKGFYCMVTMIGHSKEPGVHFTKVRTNEFCSTNSLSSC